MKQRCSLCNSEEIAIVSSPASKKVTVSDADFSPTVSDFGIFYTLAQCKTCGVLFALLNDTEIDISRLHANSKDSLYLSQAYERGAMYRRILHRLGSLSNQRQPRLLDVGCSYGTFLELARVRGFDVCGVEVNREAACYCTESLGLNVFCGDNIREAGFPDNHFDVVTALEVIDHLDDPAGFIRQVHRVIKPSGVLFIVTPNTKSLSARLLGRRWWSFRRMHLYYFSEDSLRALLVRNGFSIMQAVPYRKTFKVAYLLQHLLALVHDGETLRVAARWLHDTLENKNLYITMSFGDIAITARKT